MVESNSAQLSEIFHALSDGTRRAMLAILAKSSASVGELAAPFEISLAAASKHIKVLERAGLVQRTVMGRTHICKLKPELLEAGMAWIRHYERFWIQRFNDEAMEQNKPLARLKNSVLSYDKPTEPVAEMDWDATKLENLMAEIPEGYPKVPSWDSMPTEDKEK